MASATVDPIGSASRRHPVRLMVGVVVPLTVVALAYALWWVSDRLLYIGPFDRAAFGWLVVIPVWLAAPVAAAFAWRRLTSRDSIVAAIVVGTMITGLAAVLFWQSVAYPDCAYGATHAPADWVVPSLILGGVIGGGLAVSGLLALRFAREGRRLSTVILGAGTEVLMVFAAILVAGAILLGPGCQRPPV
jgi:hypothetical protein